MKIVRWVSYIAVAAVLGLTTQNTAYATADSKSKSDIKTGQIAARVNDTEIKLSEVKDLENALPPQLKAQAKDKDKLFALLRDQLIDLNLVEVEAMKSGLENDSDVKAALAKAKRQIVVQAYLAKTIKDKVTEPATRDLYDQEVKNIPKDAMEVKAKHILVKDEKTAQDIIKKLSAGTDFGKLARDYSIDKATSSNGGDIDYFQKDEMVPEFAQAAFDLKPGEYTKTAVKTQFGYHIIKIDDRRKVKPKKFEDEVERLQSVLAEKVMGELVQKLRESAKIERFDQGGKPDKALIENLTAPDNAKVTAAPTA